MDILSFAIRAVLVFFFTYFATRFLTKKAIAEMTAYEIAGLMILANVAAEPLVSKVVVKSVFGTGILVILMIISARLALVNKLTPIMEHIPTVVVRNGNIVMKALKDSNLSLNQLNGLIREKGYSKMSDVEFAILEPQGVLSVIPKSQSRPIVTKDLNIITQYEGLTLPLIMDGALIEANLKHAYLNEDWLQAELFKQNISDYKTQVIQAELDTSGKLTVIRTDMQ